MACWLGSVSAEPLPFCGIRFDDLHDSVAGPGRRMQTLAEFIDGLMVKATDGHGMAIGDRRQVGVHLERQARGHMPVRFVEVGDQRAAAGDVRCTSGPWLKKMLPAIAPTALSRSASASTMLGDLPPSWSHTRLRLDSAA
jgi:hypothetical protein